MEDDEYQSRRAALIQLARTSTAAFYLSLLGEITAEQLDALVDPINTKLISDTCTELDSQFRSYVFSSNYIVRPEASHPLTNLATAFLISEHYPSTDTVVAFPAGSTELGCLTAEALAYINHNRTVNLVLLSLSLHSSKKQFKGLGGYSSDKGMADIVIANSEFLDGKDVILVDDNSSTGRTMDKAAKLIKHHVSPNRLNCVVAESDIIRTRLDLNDSKRTHIANPILYNDSVGILPVSRRLRPKHNLREVMEERKLAIYYKKKAEVALTIEEKIKYEVFADGARLPMYVFFDRHKPDEFIDSFHGTFLSNFYAVPVEIGGLRYPSVEHAYQSAKFDPEMIRSLSPERQEEIKEYLREKGYGREIADLSTIFADDTITSGIIKVVADKFRDFGIIASDWDERRVDTMTGLLVQKFKDPVLAKRLVDTGEKILVEGNDWNDTFWGIDTKNRKGRNILGRLLMNIREKLRTGEIEPIESPSI